MKAEKKFALLTAWMLLLSSFFLMSFTDIVDTSLPSGADNPAEADDNMRRIQGGFQELLNVDHIFDLTGTEISGADSGEHRKILFHAPIATTPTVAADHGDLRIKDVGDKAELHWTDEDENEIQLTSGGFLIFDKSPIFTLGIVANNAYLVGRNAADNGNVDMIKVTAADAIRIGNTANATILSESSQLAPSASVSANDHIANKKYVDDNVGSANYTPTSYAGEASVTLPNGLIIKMGTKTGLSSSAPKTVDFNVDAVADFPTAVITVSATWIDSGTQNEPVKVHTVGTASMVIATSSGSSGNVYWMAFGY